MPTVLVTGGSGFVGSHVVVAALEQGYRVNTTVRSKEMEEFIKQIVKHKIGSTAKCKIFKADLMGDTGWADAVRGCTYVLHVASPFPITPPKDESEVIRPAVDGTLRVLQAAKDSGTVKRVVMTSSIAAVGYGHKDNSRVFDEKDWTNSRWPDLPSTHKSKYLAERAAWKFMKKNKGSMELSVVNPADIFGPPLGRRYGGSIISLKMIVDGTLPMYPNVWLPSVDVRDVAELELMVMTSSKAAGERYIAVSGKTVESREVMAAMREAFKDELDVPTKPIPGWIFRLLHFFGASLGDIAVELTPKQYSSEKAIKAFHWKPRNPAESIIDTVRAIKTLES